MAERSKDLQSLRKELETLLRDPKELSLVVDDAGLPRARLDLSGRLEDQLQDVLRYVRGAGDIHLHRFLGSVRARYPDAPLPVLEGLLPKGSAIPEAPTAPLAHRVPHAIWVGREDELKTLADVLLSPTGPEVGRVAICALQGMPGVGKTYLAEHFAGQHRERFPSGVVKITLNPEGPRALDQLLAEIGKELGLKEVTAAQLAGAIDAHLAGRPGLLLIDNADSPAATQVVVDLAKALPRAPMIVTGRDKRLGRGGPESPFQRLELSPFHEGSGQSLQLLTQELEARGYPLPPEADARRLVEALGHLPLAIHLTAVHLLPGVSVDHVLTKLRRKGYTLADPSPDSHLSDAVARGVLHSTFDLSLEALRQEGGEEGDKYVSALRALAHAPLPGFGTSLGAAAASLDPFDYVEATQAALALSLLTAVPAEVRPDHALRIHPLLREWLQHKPDVQAPAREGIWRWFLEHVSEEPREGRSERWASLNKEISGLLEWLWAHEDRSEIVRNAAIAGYTYAGKHGLKTAWIRLTIEAVDVTDEQNSKLQLLFQLAHLQQQAGLLSDARASTNKFIGLARKTNSLKDQIVGLGMLSDIYLDEGDFSKALQLEERILSAHRKSNDIREVSVSKRKMADIHMNRRQFRRAGMLLREAIALGEEARRPDDVAVFQGRLALLNIKTGNIPEAIHLANISSAYHDATGDRFNFAVTQNTLAEALQTPSALQDLERSLHIRTSISLPIFQSLENIREVAVTQSRIADTYTKLERWDDAIMTLSQHVLPQLKQFGYAYDLMLNQANLAYCLAKRNKPNDGDLARIHFQSAIHLAKKNSWPEWDSITRSARDAGLL